jgi:hypothetical protein
MYHTSAQGERRTFTLTTALGVGYDPTLIHHPEVAYGATRKWLTHRRAAGAIAISGFFTEATILYVREDEQGQLADGFEPALRFWGEVSLRRLADTPDEDIIPVLNDLADTLGEALGQEDVSVTYRDLAWVRSRIEADVEQ